jgi:hypothetical protein
MISQEIYWTAQRALEQLFQQLDRPLGERGSYERSCCEGILEEALIETYKRARGQSYLI